MKLRVNCPNVYCLAKNSMVSVNYFEKKKSSDRIAFYLCTKCSWPSLEKFPFSNEIESVQFLIIRGFNQKEIEDLQAIHSPKCILCKQSTVILKESRLLTMEEAEEIAELNPHKKFTDILENTRQLEDVERKSVIKLYLEAERFDIKRQFAGYLCLKCKTAFFIKSLPKIQWDISGWKDERAEYLPDQKELDFMSKGVRFGTLGSFHTRGALFGTEDYQYRTILIPNKKIDRVGKILKKLGCKFA